MNTEFYWIAVAAVTVISAARITRLLSVDKFPPIKYLRDWYENATDGSDWSLLTICVYCMSFWVTLGVTLWGLLAHVYGHPPNQVSGNVWWAVNGIFAAAYLAGLFVALDKGEGD
jgi:hypothetical protein